MAYGVVYQVTNLVNGRVYVGQITGSLDRLWTLPELIDAGHAVPGMPLSRLSSRVNNLCWDIERALKTPSARG